MLSLSQFRPETLPNDCDIVLIHTFSIDMKTISLKMFRNSKKFDADFCDSTRGVNSTYWRKISKRIVNYVWYTGLLIIIPGILSQNLRPNENLV